MPASAPERILCDTSFVGLTEKGIPGHWPGEVVERLDRAILAISVITLAEVRAGHIYAGWGTKRVEVAENRLETFVQIPLDLEVVSRWAELQAANLKGAWNVGNNDLWIAATAVSRGLHLATCDGDHRRIKDGRLGLMHLPAKAGGS